MFKKFQNRIITIEGADGTGKDTVINILHEKYPNSYIARFPDRSNISGNIINKILKKEIAFPDSFAFQSLMLVNKIETLLSVNNDKKINPKLFFFCRYYESAMIYGLNDGIPPEYSFTINSILPKSEITFILDGKKYRTDSEHYEQTEAQNNIAKNYRILAKTYNWNIINNARTPDEIADDILQKIINHMNEKYEYWDGIL
jgi:thymidylate kinase